MAALSAVRAPVLTATATPFVAVLLFLLAALVFAGFPASVLFQAAGQSRPLLWSELLGCLALGGAAVFLVRWLRGPQLVQRAVAKLHAWPYPSLWTVLIAGLGLRALAILAIAPQPSSDGLTYLGLARGILTSGQYGNESGWAYWPPGMAMALAPLLAFAPQAVALAIFTLACFVVTALGLHRLGLDLGMARSAVWPVLLLAVWPTHVLLSGLPEKEMLVIASLPWVLWATHRAFSHVGWGLLAGLLLGAIVLVQPSFQLLPLFAVVLALLAGQHWRGVMAVLMAVLLGAAFVVTPWTLRNASVLGEPVLISTNGGSNLYRANNERATGGYVAVGRIDVEALPELESNREGKRLALEWIRSHPMEFTQLTLGRVLLFPGDHSYGVYAAFRADPKRVPRPLYLALKTGTAASWLLLWGLLVGATWWHWQERKPLPNGTLLLLLPWLYLAGIHAIFESGSKYHLSTLACVLLLVMLVLRSSAVPSNEPKGAA